MSRWDGAAGARPRRCYRPGGSAEGFIDNRARASSQTRPQRYALGRSTPGRGVGPRRWPIFARRALVQFAESISNRMRPMSKDEPQLTRRELIPPSIGKFVVAFLP